MANMTKLSSLQIVDTFYMSQCNQVPRKREISKSIGQLDLNFPKSDQTFRCTVSCVAFVAVCLQIIQRNVKGAWQ